MKLETATTLINEHLYENKHRIKKAFYTGDVLLQLKNVGIPEIVVVDLFGELEETVIESDVAVHYSTDADFWVKVAAHAGFMLGGIIDGHEYVLAENKLRRKSQCVNNEGEYKCISSHPAIPSITSLKQALLYERTTSRIV